MIFILKMVRMYALLQDVESITVDVMKVVMMVYILFMKKMQMYAMKKSIMAKEAEAGQES